MTDEAREAVETVASEYVEDTRCVACGADMTPDACGHDDPDGRYLVCIECGRVHEKTHH